MMTSLTTHGDKLMPNVIMPYDKKNAQSIHDFFAAICDANQLGNDTDLNTISIIEIIKHFNKLLNEHSVKNNPEYRAQLIATATNHFTAHSTDLIATIQASLDNHMNETKRPWWLLGLIKIFVLSKAERNDIAELKNAIAQQLAAVSTMESTTDTLEVEAEVQPVVQSAALSQSKIDIAIDDSWNPYLVQPTSPSRRQVYLFGQPCDQVSYEAPEMSDAEVESCLSRLLKETPKPMPRAH